MIAGCMLRYIFFMLTLDYIFASHSQIIPQHFKPGSPSHAVCIPELSPHIQSGCQRSERCFDLRELQVPAFHLHCGP